MAAQELLLLLLLCSSIHAEVILPAQSYVFHLDDTADFCSVSRWTAEGTQLLWNSSRSPYLLHSLDASHSGQYLEQCWTRGNLTLDRKTSLLVCAGTQSTIDQGLYPNVGETVVMSCDGVGPNRSVQWAYVGYEYYDGRKLILIDNDTPSKYKHQVVENEPALQLAVNRASIDMSYYCLEKQQLSCHVHGHFYVRASSELVLRWVGEGLELDCPDGSRNQPPLWRMDNSLKSGTESHNSTLMFPSLTLGHAGYYICKLSGAVVKNYHLFVCPEPEPPAVELFTEGANLTLSCGNWNETAWVLWFVRSNRTNARVSHVSKNHVNVPGSSLVMRNVSLQDSGQVWCVVKSGGLCVFMSETLLKLREPEVDHLLLRSVLLSAVVLTLCVVGVVVGVVWRGRRGEQLPAAEEEMEMSQLSPESEVQEETPV